MPGLAKGPPRPTRNTIDAIQCGRDVREARRLRQVEVPQLVENVFLQLTDVERCILLLNGSKVGTANPKKKQRCLNCHCKGGGKQRCLNRRQVQRQFTMVVAPPTNGWGSAPATPRDPIAWRGCVTWIDARDMPNGAAAAVHYTRTHGNKCRNPRWTLPL